MRNFISFLCVLVFSIFLSCNDCLANEIGGEFNNNIPSESQSKDLETDLNDKGNIPRASNEDIFGDEQAFPFVAGLGKNAAH
tara:strand:- start:486 stop:731 length:246 start_codon:yes stop_codon:yes gene_type:complete